MRLNCMNIYILPKISFQKKWEGKIWENLIMRLYYANLFLLLPKFPYKREGAKTMKWNKLRLNCVNLNVLIKFPLKRSRGRNIRGNQIMRLNYANVYFLLKFRFKWEGAKNTRALNYETKLREPLFFA